MLKITKLSFSCHPQWLLQANEYKDLEKSLAQEMLFSMVMHTNQKFWFWKCMGTEMEIEEWVGKYLKPELF